MTLNGKIIDDYIDSRFLQERIQLKIYLPLNFSALYTYQVVIAQDGDDYLVKGKLATLTDELLAKKKIQNCIVVMIPYLTIADRYDKYSPEGTKNKDYIRFLAEEVIPHVESKYHTFELASGRTLLGDSLAATVSLHTAIEYPHTFGQVIAQSPFIGQKTLEALRSIKKPELLRIYHSIGVNETAVVTTKGETLDFLTPNRTFYDMALEKGIDVSYEEFNGDHTWTYWQKDLENALLTMLKKV